MQFSASHSTLRKRNSFAGRLALVHHHAPVAAADQDRVNEVLKKNPPNLRMPLFPG
jgi:hypothetical protein